MHNDTIFQVFKGSALSILVLWTIFANTLVFIVLYKNPRLQTVPNLLVGNLAFSDLCLGIIVLPLSSIYAIAGEWLFPETLCIIFVSADILCSTASIWNLSIVGLDRYWAITTPVAYMSKRNKRTACIMILSVWISSMLISLAPLLGWKQVAEHGNLVQINGTWQCTFLDLPSYTIYSATGSFFIPTIVMFFVYFKIYQAFAKHRARQIYRQKVIRKHIESTILHEISHVLPTSDEFAKDDEEDDNSDDNNKKFRGKKHQEIDDDEELERSPNPNSRSSYSSTSDEIESEEYTSSNECKTNFKSDNLKRTMISLLIKKQNEKTLCPERRKSKKSQEENSQVSNGYTSTCETSMMANSVIVRRQTSPPAQFVHDNDTTISILSDTTSKASSVVMYSEPDSSTANERTEAYMRTDTIGTAAITTSSRAARAAVANSIKIRFPVSRISSMPTKSAYYGRERYYHSQYPKMRRHVEVESPPVAISYEKVKRHKQRKEHAYRRSLQRKPKAISAAKERRGVKVLGIILGCFTICWTPFFVMYVLVQFCTRCAMNKHIEMFITWLGYSNSAMNPIIYTVFNRDYQIALKRLFSSNISKQTYNNFMNNKRNNNVNNAFNDSSNKVELLKSRRELIMTASRVVSSPPQINQIDKSLNCGISTMIQKKN